jgi:hypothetical protein
MGESLSARSRLNDGRDSREFRFQQTETQFFSQPGHKRAFFQQSFE